MEIEPSQNVPTPMLIESSEDEADEEESLDPDSDIESDTDDTEPTNTVAEVISTESPGDCFKIKDYFLCVAGYKVKGERLWKTPKAYLKIVKTFSELLTNTTKDHQNYHLFRKSKKKGQGAMSVLLTMEEVFNTSLSSWTKLFKQINENISYMTSWNLKKASGEIKQLAEVQAETNGEDLSLLKLNRSCPALQKMAANGLRTKVSKVRSSQQCTTELQNMNTSTWSTIATIADQRADAGSCLKSLLKGSLVEDEIFESSTMKGITGISQTILVNTDTKQVSYTSPALEDASLFLDVRIYPGEAAHTCSPKDIWKKLKQKSIVSLTARDPLISVIFSVQKELLQRARNQNWERAQKHLRSDS